MIFDVQKTLNHIIMDYGQSTNWTHFSFALIDFHNEKFCASNFEVTPNHVTFVSDKKFFFDLASLTKALTNSFLYFQRPDLFHHNPQMNWLLDHEAGLPMGGRLGRHDWKTFLKSYELGHSQSLYSDYSSLRLMLEVLEKSSFAETYGKLFEHIYDPETFFWNFKDQTSKEALIFPPTGMRHQKIIQGEVHDDNAFVINEFTTHAGLFSSVEGLAQTLLNAEKSWGFLDIMHNDLQPLIEQNLWSKRFLHGFDRPTQFRFQNTPDDSWGLYSTLAGLNASPYTIGHLGFTGTSFWIHTESKMGIVLLSNGTVNQWYQKEQLNFFRRILGGTFWNAIFQRH